MLGQVVQESIQSSLSGAQQPLYPQVGNVYPPQPYSAQGLPMPVLQAIGPSTLTSNSWSKVMMHFACRNLRDLDVLSKSDPMVVVFTEVRTPKSKEWYEIGRTEVVNNNLNPDFTTCVTIDYRFEEHQKLKFEVYDCDSSSKNLTKHDFLGRAETSLGSIMGENYGKYERQLTTMAGTNAGKILITAEELSSCKESLYIRFEGRKLDKKDFFGLSDPFLIFYKCNEDNSFTAVHKTEVIKNTLNPSWKECNIPVVSLCNGDYDRIIKVVCYDWDSDGSHDLIGESSFSLNELQKNLKFSTGLINPKKKAKKKGYKNSGYLDMVSFRIETTPSFLDYVHAGTELCFSVAVDFTASNGDPSQLPSLHYNNPYKPNDYIRALSSVGLICQDYDTDKLFPAFGFGAKVPPNYDVSHMFPLNGTQDPNCFGVDGILQAYNLAVKNVHLYGPTNFAKVINQTAMVATQEEKLYPGKKYFILLILTDGIISDMEQTKKAIIMASYLPMSIIIVGIGPAEFDAMEELDADKNVLSSGAHKADRDIVQFVPFRNFDGHGHVAGDALAREVLAEIPGQFTSYMKKRGIKPNQIKMSYK